MALGPVTMRRALTETSAANEHTNLNVGGNNVSADHRAYEVP